MATLPNIAPLNTVNNTYTTVSSFSITVLSVTSGSGLFLAISEMNRVHQRHLLLPLQEEEPGLR